MLDEEEVRTTRFVRGRHLAAPRARREISSRRLDLTTRAIATASHTRTHAHTHADPPHSVSLDERLNEQTTHDNNRPNPKRQVYGMSECTGACTWSTDRAHVWGSCGFAMPGVEMKVVQRACSDDSRCVFVVEGSGVSTTKTYRSMM